jgi:DNA-binding MarR family transcriptional regulator
MSESGQNVEIVDLLREVNRSLRERLLQGMTDTNRPIASLALLRTLAEEPGVSLNELARRKHMPKSLVSLILTDLSDDGLVRKAEDPSDRRLVRLHLTTKGKGELERWRAAYRAVASKEIGALSSEDAAQLLNGLRALRDVVTLRTSDPSGAR